MGSEYLNYRPFRYHEIVGCIRSWRRSGATGVQIRTGTLEVYQLANAETPVTMYQLIERGNVWTNTRRFFHRDFNFFRHIYRVITRQGLTSFWWEVALRDDRWVDINRDRNFNEFLPYIGVYIDPSNDRLMIWNFYNQVYMKVTPTMREQRSSSYNPNQIPQPNPLDQITPTSERPSSNVILPTATEVGNDLGFVSSDDDCGN